MASWRLVTQKLYDYQLQVQFCHKHSCPKTKVRSSSGQNGLAAEKSHWKKKLVQKARLDHSTTLHYIISYCLLSVVVMMFQGPFRVTIVWKADNWWLPILDLYDSQKDCLRCSWQFCKKPGRNVGFRRIILRNQAKGRNFE